MQITYRKYILWQTRREIDRQERLINYLLDNVIFANPFERRVASSKLIAIERRIKLLKISLNRLDLELTQLAKLVHKLVKKVLSRAFRRN
jgi:hypothetical protein